MKRTFAACALFASALVLAACSPDPKPEEAATLGDGAAAKRVPLPDCASVEAVDAGADGWKHPDCRLMIPGEANLAFEARYTPAEDESTLVSIQIVQPGDATIQTIEETMGNTFNSPSVQDIDEDGLTDILVPLETGNVNTSHAIWRQHADNSFVRIGELSGVSIVKTASGYIAVQARSSASSWTVPFLKLEGDALVPVLAAEVTASGDDAGNVTSVACAVVDDGGLEAAGFTPETAKAAFCAESVVTGIFK